MADTIASLMIIINAAQAALATAEMDKLTAASGKTETAVKRAGDASKEAAAGMSAIPAALREIDARTDALRASVDPLANSMKRANAEMLEAKSLYAIGAIGAQEYARYLSILEGRLESATAAQAALNGMQVRGAATARLTTQESLNLSRQFADVGVSLASGMPLWMVAIQQGSQIGDTFQTAGMRGVGFGAVIKDVTQSLGGLVRAFLPVLAVAAAVTAALATTAHTLNRTGEEADDLQRRLGLTDAEMKKLGNTSITMADVVAGSAQYASDKLWEAFGPTLTAIGKQIEETFNSGVDWVLKSTRTMVAVVGAGTGYMVVGWRNLTIAVGAAAVEMANSFISTVEKMLNGSISRINAYIGALNTLTKGFGLTLPTIDPMQLETFKLKYEGDGESLAASLAKGVARGSAAALAEFDRITGGWVTSVRKANSDRVDALADEIKRLRKSGTSGGASTGSSSGDAAPDEFLEGIEAFNAQLRERNRLVAEYERITKSLVDDKALFDAEATMLIRQRAEAYAYAADLMAVTNDQVQDAARGMAGAFGKVGAAIGDVTSLMGRYASRQADLMAARKAEGVTAQQVALIDRAAARERIAYYGDMLGAAKGFFKEGSDGYKAMQAVEAGYRAWQMAMSIQAMIQAQVEAATQVQSAATAVAAHTTAAGVTMATDAATTSTGIAAGAARIFAKMGPYGFPIVAAMLGVMASLGAGGGGGGASGPSASEQQQRMQGAGSVLGDASAKSESIARSLEIVASNTNSDLEYSNAMLRALRSIDDQIGVVAAAVARQLGASGVLDTSSLGLGTSGRAPSLSNLGFGNVTTRTLQDMGLQFAAQGLSDILANGLQGSAYSIIEQTKKKSAFGITFSSKTTTSANQTAIDAALSEEFTRLISSLRDGVLASAAVLGVTGAEAALNAFSVNIGKISLKDMSGAEIEQAIAAVFSKVGDDMAGTVIPGLKAVQDVGEGLFETLTRVARQYQVIDLSLASLGMTFGQVGVSSIGARERLIDLFGGLDNFADATAAYAEDFLSEAQRLAPVQNAVAAELARLGLSGIKTRDQFRDVVQGLDASTAAGADLFAALMALAPAFAKITEETRAVTDAREALSSAYERESGVIIDARDRFRDLAAGLGDFRKSLYSGPAAALSPEAAYMAAQAEFQRVRGLAAGGDAKALGELQGVSQAYLDASKAYYASSAGYFADLEAVRAAVTAAEGIATQQADVAVQQLEALKAQVGSLISIDENILTVAQAITALNAALGVQGVPNAPAVPVSASTAPANDNSAVVAALQEQNGLLRQQLATMQAQLDQRAAIFNAEARQAEDENAQLRRVLRDMTA